MLFREPEYQDMLGKTRKAFEFNHAGDDKVEEIREWTKTGNTRKRTSPAKR
jgi:hypothetical protein